MPILAIISALVMFFSVGAWMISYHNDNQKISVLVAAKDINTPARLANDDFKIKLVPKGAVSKTAVSKFADVQGLTLLYPLSENEILNRNHLAKTPSPYSESLLVEKESLGFSLPVDWLAARPPKIDAGDFVFFLASTPGKTMDKGITILPKPIMVLKVDNDRDGLPTRVFLNVNVVQAGTIIQSRSNNLNLALLVMPFLP